jgi:cystathionine beta-lyase/cystathionine gamma-synthase
VVALSGGYHGVHGVLRVLERLYGVRTVDLHAGEAAWEAAGLGAGDLVHIETPRNPHGEAVDAERLVRAARARGARVSLDATFAPPPLLDPWRLGADVVLHAATKYLGGHSDLLCGVLVTRDDGLWRGLWEDRILLGGVVGGLEAWLGIRSLRTLELRVRAQSANAEKLVDWIYECVEGRGGEDAQSVREAVVAVHHASVQARLPGNEWVREQMPNGFGPVFALTMKTEDMARILPSKLGLFHHATSLGGVESLIEWRRMTDVGVDPRLVRVSVGIEGCEDLKRDLEAGFKAVVEELKNVKESGELVEHK